jgi:hypothetical protein
MRRDPVSALIERRLQELPIRVVNVFTPKNENHFLDLIVRREKFAGRFQRNVRGLLERITVSAATDRRKRYCFDFIVHRELQRIAVAICECPRFVMFPATPNGSDSVNHEASEQTICAGNFRLAGFTTAECAAFGEQFGAGGAVNRAIDTATAEKRRVCRVHNGINLELCDIAAEDFNSAVGILHESWIYNDEVRMTNDERNQNAEMTKPAIS